MNFEVMEQLMNEQRAAIKENRDAAAALKVAFEAAETELSTVDKNSRAAFAIKGEIAQLKEAITENEVEYRRIIEERAKPMKQQLEKNKNDLIAENDAKLKEKYAEDVKLAMDRLIELKEGYLSEEATFIDSLRNDIREFRLFDDRNYPDVSSMMMGLGSFGYAYIFNKQLDRLNK